MSSASSPEHLARFDMNFVPDSLYTEDINKKMRVPKRIRVGEDTASSDDDFPNGLTNNSHWANAMNQERFDMKVPERIIITGSGQHVGTKTMPREMVLENQVMPPDPGMVRVATPPRIITLDKYHYPSVKDPPPEQEPPTVKPRSRFNTGDKNASYGGQDGDVLSMLNSSNAPIGAGDGLTPAEEVQHLRKQLVKLNRRVMSLELESAQRHQKEKLVYGIGLAYFIIKAILWLNRN